MTCHPSVISAVVDTESAQRWRIVQASRWPLFPEQDEVGQWQKIYPADPRSDCRLATVHPASVRQRSANSSRSRSDRKVLSCCYWHPVWHLPRKWVCCLSFRRVISEVAWLIVTKFCQVFDWWRRFIKFGQKFGWPLPPKFGIPKTSKFHDFNQLCNFIAIVSGTQQDFHLLDDGAANCGHWATSLFDLAFCWAFCWAKPKAER